MSKAYWVVAWISVSDQSAVERYLAPATAAIEAHGGRVVAAGIPIRSYEEGRSSRVVLVEFDSVDTAVAAYESPAYQSAVAFLSGAAERDVRLIPAIS